MGSNMAECHPVAFRWPMKAKLNGAKLIHVDPRFTRTSAVADLHVPIRAGAGEAGVDVDQLRAVELRLHGPAERHRVALRHVRTHDHEAVGVLEVARIQRRRAATEPCPQTGDARAVSYPGLVLDGDDPEPTPELLTHVVELVVERRAAEREDRRRHVDELAVRELLDERLVAGLLDQLGDPVHRPLELDDLPVRRAGLAVQHLRRPVGIHVELIDRRALGAEGALVVRAARVAFDVDDLPVDRVDQGGAADGAEGTDARGGLRVLDSQLLRSRRGRRQRHPQPHHPADRRSRPGAGREPDEITSTDLHTVLPLRSGLACAKPVGRDDIRIAFGGRNPGASGTRAVALESAPQAERGRGPMLELPELTPESFEILAVRELRKVGLEVSPLRVHRRATLPEPERGYLLELKGVISRARWQRRNLIACRRQQVPIGRAAVESLRAHVTEAGVEAGILFGTAAFEADALNAVQASPLALLRVSDGRTG